MAFKAGELLEVQSFKKHLGEDNLKVRSHRTLSFSSSRWWSICPLHRASVAHCVVSGLAPPQRLLNFLLHYIADLDIPIKRCVRPHPLPRRRRVHSSVPRSLRPGSDPFVHLKGSRDPCMVGRTPDICLA